MPTTSHGGPWIFCFFLFFCSCVSVLSLFLFFSPFFRRRPLSQSKKARKKGGSTPGGGGAGCYPRRRRISGVVALLRARARPPVVSLVFVGLRFFSLVFVPKKKQ
nr:hypothetical protein [Pandoravirus belohorizontensis]